MNLVLTNANENKLYKFKITEKDFLTSQIWLFGRIYVCSWETLESESGWQHLHSGFSETGFQNLAQSMLSNWVQIDVEVSSANPEKADLIQLIQPRWLGGRVVD